MMPEVWKLFGKNNCYRISNAGVVQSRYRTNKVLTNTWADKKLKKSKTDARGGFYMTFSLTTGHVRLHTFMWETFRGPRTKGMVINHIDGDRTNCAIWNLEEITQKENVENLIKRGNFKLFGNPHTPKKATEQDQPADADRIGDNVCDVVDGMGVCDDLSLLGSVG